jgi:predicted ATP-binding protein involved in virulence
MKLKSLEIKNFRCFESLSIDFDEQLTVLVAENGAGKTAILDAVSVALAPFIGGFDTGIGKGFKPEDAKLGVAARLLHNGKFLLVQGIHRVSEMESQYPISLIASGIIDGQFEQWSRELTGRKTQTTFGKARVLIDYAKKLQQQVRLYEPVTLPIIAYYGTGRLLKPNKTNAKSFTKSQSRLYGYNDSLNPNSNYKNFEKWFIDESIAEYINESKARNELFNSAKKLLIDEGIISADDDFGSPVPASHNPANRLFSKIKYIQKAINQCLSVSGWHTLEYEPNWRELIVTNANKDFMPVARLSDGVKAMLSLTADIAYRCVQLNPHLIHQNPDYPSPLEETSGIVLIDEIDLHLHPKWQQTVLSDLQKTFPKIQFIVTTHSPQVLSSIHRKSIRLLGKDSHGRDVAVMPRAESYGEISSDVLQSIMHVNPQPPVAEKSELDRLTELVDQGLYHTEKKTVDDLFAKLKTALGETHPQLQRLARSVKRQEMLKS